MNEKELLQQIADLPREIEPPGDGWPGIEARIQDESRAPAGRSGLRRPGVWAVAASVLVAFTVGWLGGQSWRTDPTPVNQAGHDMALQTAVPAQAAYAQMLAATEAEYQAAFREFIPVGASRGQLSQATLENIELGWADLLAAETALARALSENPADPFLVRKMIDLRAKQLLFLQQLASLDQMNRRINI